MTSGWARKQGEPAQHPSAHLLLHQIFQCQRGRLGEMDLPVVARGEHPVDHAAVEVHMRVQRQPLSRMWGARSKGPQGFAGRALEASGRAERGFRGIVRYREG